MPTILRASLALTALPILAACTSSNPTYDAGPQPQLCPTTIEEATAAPGAEGTTSACHMANFVCAVSFTCGSFIQQASCTCDGKVFTCVLPGTDAGLGPIDDGGSLCQSTESDGSANTCPTDKTTASGTPCTNAGQICVYQSSCTTSPPPQDTCQCIGDQVDAGLSWSCDINCP